MYNIDNPSDWNPIIKEYVDSISDRKKILHVNAGSLVLWDSRTFHQNTCGTPTCEEERLIQYLCYLPRYEEGNTKKEQEQRNKFFVKKRTTSHWPYPMNPVPEQPNMYNYYCAESKEDCINIDYDSLPKPDLEDLMPKIEQLL